MGQFEPKSPGQLLCADCAALLGADCGSERATAGSPCERCGRPVRPQSPAAANCTPRAAAIPANSPALPGHFMLLWRNWLVGMVVSLYWIGTLGGAAVMLVLGGFVPVLRGWLRNEIRGWSDVVAALGGVWFSVECVDPDSDLGPVLARVDAPLLFSTIDHVG